MCIGFGGEPSIIVHKHKQRNRFYSSFKRKVCCLFCACIFTLQCVFAISNLETFSTVKAAFVYYSDVRSMYNDRSRSSEMLIHLSLNMFLAVVCVCGGRGRSGGTGG